MDKISLNPKTSYIKVENIKSEKNSLGFVSILNSDTEEIASPKELLEALKEVFKELSDSTDKADNEEDALIKPLKKLKLRTLHF